MLKSIFLLLLCVFLMFSGTACSQEFADALLDAAIDEMEATQPVPDTTASLQTAPSATPSVEETAGTRPDGEAESGLPAAATDQTPAMASEPPADEVPDLDALHDPSLFTRTALEHIFIGSVNSRGAASGYHSEAYPEALGEVISGTRSTPDADGVYEAKVRVDGIDKAGNRGYSTFFPADMTVAQVVHAIREAYETREPVTGNTWRGEGGDLSILMYLDDNDRIISAFPEYGG